MTIEEINKMFVEFEKITKIETKEDRIKFDSLKTMMLAEIKQLRCLYCSDGGELYDSILHDVPICKRCGARAK